jgi:ubiquinone biosynthesis protein
MRGLPVKQMSIGMMLDSLFTITRDFDMATQPHLLLLQKTMVMVEGVATSLDPDINLWETAGPLVEEWIRTELGPEAAIADRLVADVRTLARLPDLVRRIEARFPAPGGAPPAPPLREIQVVRVGGGWRYVAVALAAAAVGAAGMFASIAW